MVNTVTIYELSRFYIRAVPERCDMNLLGRIDLDMMHSKILTTDVLSLCVEKIIGWPGGSGSMAR